MKMNKDSDVVKTIAKVYVGGLAENVEKHHLEEIFERFGLVKTVWIARNPLSRGYAFVTFFEPKHAEEAVKGVDGTSLLGSKLKVQLSKNEIVKMERDQKDREKDSRDFMDQRRHRPRDRGRYEDRKRGRSWDRERSPVERRYDDERARGVSPTTLDPGVIQESLMLREAVLRSGLSPYSFITNSLLQTAALPSIPITCVKSPAFGTSLNYLPYPPTLTDLRQQSDITPHITGQGIILPTAIPPNGPPSVPYPHTVPGMHSSFIQSSTTFPTPQHRHGTKTMTPEVSCTVHGNESSSVGFSSGGHQPNHPQGGSELPK
ncbi:uncharacterized protein LOC133175718 [Saccostrea echinata]|uniref:uncharacterized protein LOC133175718 n=1 Tax=Saccostrea echinata TaxID=191078 RepID=UPI002A83817C|nr:uncharacterized protein LOC133175718 [Saccostrea echinata]